MKIRLILADIVFWIHFSAITLWFGLFLIPTSVWPDRITFHFYYTLIIVGHQIIWGLIILPWAKQFRMVCFLTTFSQLLNKENISDPRNYDHRVPKKFSFNHNIKISHTFSTILTFICASIVVFQYLSQR